MEEMTDVQKTLIEDTRTFQLGQTENDMACPNCDYYGKMAITSIPRTTNAASSLSTFIFLGIAIMAILYGVVDCTMENIDFLSTISTIFVIVIVIAYIGISISNKFIHPTVKCPKCRATLNLK